MRETRICGHLDNMQDLQAPWSPSTTGYPAYWTRQWKTLCVGCSPRYLV